MRIKLIILGAMSILLTHMACREINVVDPQEVTNEKDRGVFFNQSFLRPAGIDTLYINEGDTVSIGVTSILINDPIYNWSNGDESVIKIEFDLASDSLIHAIAVADSGMYTEIILEDSGNEITKILPVKIVKFWADPLQYAYIGSHTRHHYYLSKYKKTWLEAKEDCEAAGGHLLTISSEEENIFVADTPLRGGLETWIGLTFLYGNNKLLYWVNGESAIEYQNYNGKPSEPGIFAEYFFYLNGEGQWENWHEISYQYILEME